MSDIKPGPLRLPWNRNALFRQIDLFQEDTLDRILGEYKSALVDEIAELPLSAKNLPDDENTRMAILALRRSEMIYKKSEGGITHSQTVGIDTECTLRALGAEPSVARLGLVIGLLHDIYSGDVPQQHLDKPIGNHYGGTLLNALKAISLKGRSIGKDTTLLGHIESTDDPENYCDLNIPSTQQSRIIAAAFLWGHQQRQMRSAGNKVSLNQKTALKLSIDLSAARLHSLVSGSTAYIGVADFIKTTPQGRHYLNPQVLGLLKPSMTYAQVAALTATHGKKDPDLIQAA
jgi:hypothetical protein